MKMREQVCLTILVLAGFYLGHPGILAQTAPPCEYTIPASSDVIFLLDVSYDITEDVFLEYKAFIRDLIMQKMLGSETTGLAFIRFANGSEASLDYISHPEAASMANYERQIYWRPEPPHNDSDPGIIEASFRAQIILSRRQNTSRPGFIIYVTDASYDQVDTSTNSSLYRLIQDVRTAGITVHGVGVGVKYTQENLDHLLQSANDSCLGMSLEDWKEYLKTAYPSQNGGNGTIFSALLVVFIMVNITIIVMIILVCIYAHKLSPPTKLPNLSREHAKSPEDERRDTRIGHDALETQTDTNNGPYSDGQTRQNIPLPRLPSQTNHPFLRPLSQNLGRKLSILKDKVIRATRPAPPIPTQQAYAHQQRAAPQPTPRQPRPRTPPSPPGQQGEIQQPVNVQTKSTPADSTPRRQQRTRISSTDRFDLPPPPPPPIVVPPTDNSRIMSVVQGAEPPEDDLFSPFHHNQQPAASKNHINNITGPEEGGDTPGFFQNDLLSVKLAAALTARKMSMANTSLVQDLEEGRGEYVNLSDLNGNNDSDSEPEEDRGDYVNIALNHSDADDHGAVLSGDDEDGINMDAGAQETHGDLYTNMTDGVLLDESQPPDDHVPDVYVNVSQRPPSYFDIFKRDLKEHLNQAKRWSRRASSMFVDSVETDQSELHSPTALSGDTLHANIPPPDMGNQAETTGYINQNANRVS